MSDMQIYAWAIQCNDNLQYSDFAHNAGLDEGYRPADARICGEVEVLLCTACTMNAPLDKGLLETLFTKSFGDRSKSPYGVALSVLLRKKDLASQELASRLLKENRFQNETKLASFAHMESAYVASPSNDNNREKKNKSNEIDCWYCNENDPYGGDSYKQKREESIKRGHRRPDIGGSGRELDDPSSAKITVDSKSKTK